MDLNVSTIDCFVDQFPSTTFPLSPNLLYQTNNFLPIIRNRNLIVWSYDFDLYYGIINTIRLLADNGIVLLLLLLSF